MTIAECIYGFVYLWYDRKRKMFYIGSHWGKPTDKYICSSDRMRHAYKRRPDDFKRRILYLHFANDRLALLQNEQRWLVMINESDLGIRYYNLVKSAHGLSPEEMSRISREHWNSPGAKQQQADHMKTLWTTERRKKHGEILRNKQNDPVHVQKLKDRKPRPPLSDAERMAVSKRNRSRSYTGDTKNKMSSSAKIRANTIAHKERFALLMQGRPAHNKKEIPLDFLPWYEATSPSLKEIGARYKISESLVLKWKQKFNLLRR